MSMKMRVKTFFVCDIVCVAFFSYLCADFGVLSAEGKVLSKKDSDYDNER